MSNMLPGSVLNSISTPDPVETQFGTLEFTDGVPSTRTAEQLYDTLDFIHGVEAFVNSYQGACVCQ